MKLKLKSKDQKAIWLKMWEKMLDGWNVTRTPYKNFFTFGNWICKLEKKTI